MDYYHRTSNSNRYFNSFDKFELVSEMLSTFFHVFLQKRSSFSGLWGRMWQELLYWMFAGGDIDKAENFPLLRVIKKLNKTNMINDNG